jgi:hypothetical protein
MVRGQTTAEALVAKFDNAGTEALNALGSFIRKASFRRSVHGEEGHIAPRALEGWYCLTRTNKLKKEHQNSLALPRLQ